MYEESIKIRDEVKKIIKGKDEVVDKVFMAILARGHVLLDDIPGVGKTTLALALSKSMGLDFKRVQFTPDVVPSDITGFSMYIKEKDDFEYKPGAAMCNFLLADEVNRTSSKTQSALLEVMQEGKITVDGVSRDIPKPFIVVATQNPIGAAGTQKLPEAQLDRFMIRLSMGYPDSKSQIELLKDRKDKDPINDVKQISNASDIIKMQDEVEKIFMDDKIYSYVTQLSEATRNNELISLGLSPRGALALCSIAKASAYLNKRDFVIPEDVDNVFVDVAIHRLVMEPKAKVKNISTEDILKDILKSIEAPVIG